MTIAGSVEVAHGGWWSRVVWQSQKRSKAGQRGNSTWRGVESEATEESPSSDAIVHGTSYAQTQDPCLDFELSESTSLLFYLKIFWTGTSPLCLKIRWGTYLSSCLLFWIKQVCVFTSLCVTRCLCPLPLFWIYSWMRFNTLGIGIFQGVWSVTEFNLEAKNTIRPL